MSRKRYANRLTGLHFEAILFYTLTALPLFPGTHPFSLPFICTRARLAHSVVDNAQVDM